MLRVEHITKSFGPTIALRDINLTLRKGEVLGLLGDNGSGKSTLIKIICGFHKQDSGRMFLHGEPYEPKSVDDAREHGIDTVYQDLALIDELSVYHNMFLRRERVHAPLPFLANAVMRREARKALDDIGINIPRLDVPVARLSGGQRQSIAVARTVYGEANILLLDEPLAAMGAKEGGMILELIERLKQEGNVSIIMVLHNYVHVLATCDRVNLIQDGEIALDKLTSETSVEELTEIVVEEYRRARQEAIAADEAAHKASASGLAVTGPAYALGVDFGTESGRALLLDLRSGAEVAVSEVRYPHGVIDRELPSRRAAAARLGAAALRRLGGGARAGDPGRCSSGAARRASTWSALGVDFTSCTVLPVDTEGVAAVHAGALRIAPARVAEAVEAPRPTAGRGPSQRSRARAWGAIPRTLRRADLLGVVLPEADRAVARGSRGLRRRSRLHRGDRLDRVVPHRHRAPPELHRGLQGDVVGGGRPARGRVLRGGLPRVRSALGEARQRVRAARHERRPLRGELAARLGLAGLVTVAVGNVDSFVSVPGAGVESPGTFVMVVGTSICDLVVDPAEVRLPGITGVVRDGILPGLYGYEAGQAAVGDMLAWFVQTLAPPGAELAAFERAAEAIGPGESGLVALDWWNGNRTILADADLSGALFGLTLQSTREQIYRCPARVDRIWQPAHHRELPRTRPRVQRDRRLRRDRRKEPAHDAAAGRYERPARERPGLRRRSPRAARRCSAPSQPAVFPDIGSAIAATRPQIARSYEPDSGAKAIYDRVYAVYRSLYERLGRSDAELLHGLKRIYTERRAS